MSAQFDVGGTGQLFLFPYPTLAYPGKLAVDRNNASLYVTDVGTARVIHMSQNGTFLAALTTSAPGFDLSPFDGVALDSAHRLWVADSGNQRVLRFTLNGSVDITLSGSAWPFSSVIPLCTDTHDVLYVLCGPSVARVTSATGHVLGSFSWTAALGGSVDTISDMAVDPLGTALYLVDLGDSRVVRISSTTGARLAVYSASDPAFTGAFTVTVSPAGLVYVGDAGRNALFVFSAAGVELGTLQAATPASRGSYGVAMDSQGQTLYASDAQLGRVILYRSVHSQSAQQTVCHYAVYSGYSVSTTLVLTVDTSAPVIQQTAGMDYTRQCSRVVGVSSGQRQVWSVAATPVLLQQNAVQDVRVVGSDNGNDNCLYTMCSPLTDSLGLSLSLQSPILVPGHSLTNRTFLRLIWNSSSAMYTESINGSLAVDTPNYSSMTLATGPGQQTTCPALTSSRYSFCLLMVSPYNYAVTFSGWMTVTGPLVPVGNSYTPTRQAMQVTAISGTRTISSWATGIPVISSTTVVGLLPVNSVVFDKYLNQSVTLNNDNRVLPSADGTQPATVSTIALRMGSNISIDSSASYPYFTTVMVLTVGNYQQMTQLTPDLILSGQRGSEPVSSSLTILPDLGAVGGSSATACPLPAEFQPIPLALGNTCVNILSPVNGTGFVNVGSHVQFTDVCMLANVTLAVLRSVNSTLTPVCRFAPGGFYSAGTISADTSNPSAPLLVTCAIPSKLGAGQFTVQLSLDGKSYGLQPLTQRSNNSLTLLTISDSVITGAAVRLPVPSGQQSASWLNLTSVSLNKPYSNATDPMPYGCNALDVIRVSYVFPSAACVGATTLHLLCQVALVGEGRTSSLQIVHQPVAVVGANLPCTTGSLLWTVPNITDLLLSAHISPARLLSWQLSPLFTTAALNLTALGLSPTAVTSPSHAGRRLLWAPFSTSTEKGIAGVGLAASAIALGLTAAAILAAPVELPAFAIGGAGYLLTRGLIGLLSSGYAYVAADYNLKYGDANDTPYFSPTSQVINTGIGLLTGYDTGLSESKGLIGVWNSRGAAYNGFLNTVDNALLIKGSNFFLSNAGEVLTLGDFVHDKGSTEPDKTQTNAQVIVGEAIHVNPSDTTYGTGDSAGDGNGAGTGNSGGGDSNGGGGDSNGGGGDSNGGSGNSDGGSSGTNPTGTSYGDVHVNSFGVPGVYSDFQGSGTYWFVQDVGIQRDLSDYQVLNGPGLSLQLELLPGNNKFGDYVNNTGSVTQASGVALRSNSHCGVIVVRPRTDVHPVTQSYLDVFDGGVQLLVPFVSFSLTTFYSYQQPYQLSCATIVITSPYSATITTFDSHTISMTAISGAQRFATVQVSMNARAVNYTQGIFGALNQTLDTAFIDRNGTDWAAVYPDNLAAAAFLRHESWRVATDESFFTAISPPTFQCGQQQIGVQYVVSCSLGSSQPPATVTTTANNASSDSTFASVVAQFNVSQLSTLPARWPNETFHALANVTCLQLLDSTNISEPLVQACLLDCYVFNTTAAATTQQSFVLQGKVNALPPLNINSTTLDNSANATIDLTPLSVTSVGGLCSSFLLSLSALSVSSTGGMSCVVTVAVKLAGVALAPEVLSFSLVNTTSLTVAASSLLPATLYTVSTSVLVVPTSGTSARSAVTSESFLTTGCTPACVADAFSPCGSDGCGGSCGTCTQAGAQCAPTTLTPVLPSSATTYNRSALFACAVFTSSSSSSSTSGKSSSSSSPAPRSSSSISSGGRSSSSSSSVLRFSSSSSSVSSSGRSSSSSSPTSSLRSSSSSSSSTVTPKSSSAGTSSPSSSKTSSSSVRSSSSSSSASMSTHSSSSSSVTRSSSSSSSSSSSGGVKSSSSSPTSSARSSSSNRSSSSSSLKSSSSSSTTSTNPTAKSSSTGASGRSSSSSSGKSSSSSSSTAAARLSSSSSSGSSSKKSSSSSSTSSPSHSSSNSSVSSSSRSSSSSSSSTSLKSSSSSSRSSSTSALKSSSAATSTRSSSSSSGGRSSSSSSSSTSAVKHSSSSSTSTPSTTSSVKP